MQVSSALEKGENIMDRKSQLEYLIDAVRPETMLEIGSWEGGSAVIFCGAAKALGIKMKVLCVDTWLGSEEHWVAKAWHKVTTSRFSFERLNMVDGEPTALQQFMNNTEAHRDSIEILRAPSQYISDYLQAYYPRFDLSYIDGDHSRKGVTIDLKTCESFNSPIAGDDWGWKSVRMAVASYLLLRNRILFIAPDLTTYILSTRNAQGANARLLIGNWRRLGKVAAWREVFLPTWTVQRLLRRLLSVYRTK